MHGLAAALVTPLLGTIPEPGTAVPDAVVAQLDWSAPDACPDAVAVQRAIDARLTGRSIAVVARVWHERDGFAAELVIESDGASSRRRLASPRCDTLVDAVILLAAIASDPLPTARSLARTFAPPPQVVVPIAPRSVPARDPVTPRPSPRRLGPRAGAMGLVGRGTLPRIDLGLRASVGVWSERVHADATLTYLSPQTHRDGPVLTRVDAWALGVQVCPVAWRLRRRVELGGCVAIAAGRVRATAEGVNTPRPQRQPWVTAAAIPQVSIELARGLRAVLGVEIGGHAFGPGFSVDGLGRVWAPRPAFARALLGLEVRL